MNSCRLSEHILPARVRKSIARHHSSCVMFASRTMACTWRTTRANTSRNLGLSASFMRSITSRVSSGKMSPLRPSLSALIDVILILRSRRSASVIGVVQELPNRLPFDRARIPIGGFNRRIGGFIQIGIRHANLAKRPRSSIGYREIEQCLCGMISAKGSSDAIDGYRRSGRIVGYCMRQDDGVRLSMRETEGSPQHVTQLLMERPPY